MRPDDERCAVCECGVCAVRGFGDNVRVALCDACHEDVLFSAIVRGEIEREVSQRISEVMQ